MTQPIQRRSKIVANNITRVRMYRQYSQQYLAAKLSISQNAYSKIEIGATRLTIERLFQIAVILDVQVGWLLSVERPTGNDLSQLSPNC
jgi:transcriptional regulator with XRE-family HTH domain